MTSNDKNDDELNDYLNGNSELSKVYREISTDTPSYDVDKNILQAAKDAIENNKSDNNHRFHRSKWSLPVSVAAMITLSVSLVVTMQQESGQELISEPKIDMQDAINVMEEAEFFDTGKRNDANSDINETLKQSKDNTLEMNVPASASLETVKDAYRVEEKVEALESRMREAPTKKIMLKEKVPSSFEDLEKRQYSENKVTTMSAGSIVSDDVKSDSMFIQSQIEELIAIKTLLEENKLEMAKTAYENFIKQYPDVTQERIKELLGSNVYNKLINL